MDFSLCAHSKGYKLSCAETMQSLVVSPYAWRHLELARSEDATWIQRWGHRTIAAIQFIPVIGLLASLIERVVSLFAQRKPDIAKPVVEAPFQDNFEQLPEAVVAKVSSCLDHEDAINFLVASRSNNDSIWRGIANANKFKIPRGENPELYVKKALAAQALVEFCQHFPSCAEVTNPGGPVVFDQAQALKMCSSVEDLPLLDQAEALRKWLSSDPGIAQITDLTLGETDHSRPRNAPPVQAPGLKALPPEIRYFTNLRRLVLKGNKLSFLPAEIGTLQHLQYLQVANNLIRVLPSEIGNLSKLHCLDASGNRIKSLPPELSNLTSLLWLQLNHNRFSTFPDVVCDMPMLDLDMAFNRMTTIPKAIGDMRRLRVLLLQHNKITSIPDEIAKLRVSILRLENNQLQEVPESLADLNVTLAETGKIYLMNNPFAPGGIPPRVAARRCLYL